MTCDETGAVRAIDVLLVDDDAADVRLLQETVRDGGYRINFKAVGTIKAALAALATEKYDAVMLDLSLPDATGLDGLLRIRDADVYIPVTVTTGMSDVDLALRAGRHGADAFVLKDQLGTKAGVCAVYCALGQSLTVSEQREHMDLVHRDLLERLERIKEEEPSVDYVDGEVEQAYHGIGG